MMIGIMGLIMMNASMIMTLTCPALRRTYVPTWQTEKSNDPTC